MSTVTCPKCGKEAPSGQLFCSNCGTYLPQPEQTVSAATLPHQKVNTHTNIWIIMAFLVSLLWFKVNGSFVFPIGFVGGLVIAGSSWDIDKQVGKQSLAYMGFIFSFIGMILGAAIQ
jgi:hypothetical protein